MSFAVNASTADPQPVAEIPANIQSGDLIFRDGDEIISDIIKTLDHSGYSHAGMVYITDQGVQVIHATPQERPGTGDVVLTDSLADFRARAKNQLIAFYHVNASAQQHASALRYALRQSGKPFGFNAQSLYCTQLIYQAWQSAGVDITTGEQWLKLPLLDTPILLPQNITGSRRLQRQ